MKKFRISIYLSIVFVTGISFAQELSIKEFKTLCSNGHRYWEDQYRYATYSGSRVIERNKTKVFEEFVFHLRLNNYCMEFFNWNLEPNGSSEGRPPCELSVYTPTYYFTLGKNTESSPFFVSRAGVMPTDEKGKFKTVLGRLANMDDYVFAATSVNGVPIKKILTEVDWKIESIETVESQTSDEFDYQVTAKHLLDDTNYDLFSFVVSPKYHYGVVSYKITHKPSNGLTDHIIGKVVYKIDEKEVLRIANVHIATFPTQAGIKKTDFESIINCEFSEFLPDCRKDIFLLTDYGLPDNNLIFSSSQKNSRLFIFLLALIFVIVIGFLISRRWNLNKL